LNGCGKARPQNRSLSTQVRPKKATLAYHRKVRKSAEESTEDEAVIPRVDNCAVNKEAKESVSIQTNGDGKYKLCLAPGIYDVFADALGFQQAKRKSVRVDKSTNRTIDFVLTKDKPVVVDNPP
jgi:carboxypeptidase family protein